MVLIPEQGADVADVAKVIGPVAFKVHRFSTEKAICKNLPHPEHLEAELVVMSRRDKALYALRLRYHNLCFFRRHGKGLLEIDMTTSVEALQRKRAMALRWARDVHDIGLLEAQQLL